MEAMAHRNRWFTMVYLLKMVIFHAMLVITRWYLNLWFLGGYRGLVPEHFGKTPHLIHQKPLIFLIQIVIDWVNPQSRASTQGRGQSHPTVDVFNTTQ
jgi:NADH:ubiquinone oxidoreductase subunit H